VGISTGGGGEYDRSRWMIMGYLCWECDLLGISPMIIVWGRVQEWDRLLDRLGTTTVGGHLLRHEQDLLLERVLGILMVWSGGVRERDLLLDCRGITITGGA